MAQWKLDPVDADIVVLRYIDAANSIDYECGRTYRTVSFKEILADFVLSHADSFDVITLTDGGTQFAFLPVHRVPV